MSGNADDTATELNDEIKGLELKLAFTRMAIKTGVLLAIIYALGSIIIFGIVAYVAVVAGKEIGGFNSSIVAVVGIAAFAIYYAFAFGREAVVHAQITAKKKELRLIAGKTAK